MRDFENATILITGAASGIGAATARLLSERGAKLILMDRDEGGLCAFDAPRIVGDVADEELWREADLSGLTHAVINAGIAEGGTPIAHLSLAEWRRVMSVNLDGAFLSLSAAMRAIKSTGGGGGIVLTASVAGIKAEPGIAAYGASKAAVLHLARIAAKEGAPDGIRVNAVAPGGVETPIWSNLAFFKDLVSTHGSEDAAYIAMASMATPLARYAKPDEIAGQIAFLLSEAAGFNTGTTLVADGGYSL